MIEVSNIRVEHRDRSIFVISDVMSSNGSKPLWYEIPEQYKAQITADRGDAYAVAFVLEAMSLGESLHVAAPVSASLMRNLRYYQYAMQSLFPNLKVVEITCDEACHFDEIFDGREAGAGFSAGVDALCTAYENYSNVLPGERLNRLVFVNTGSNGPGETGERVFRKRQLRLHRAAECIGLPILFINSNLDQHCSVSYGESLAARIVSCVLFLQKLFHTYLMPSSNAYPDLCPDASTPLSDHLLSTGATRIVHDGAQHYRLDKFNLLANWKIAQQHLNVCGVETSDMSNCSQCEKCVMAMLTLDMLGHAEKFGSVFDFNLLPILREDLVTQKMQKGTESPHFLWREVVRYAESSGYSL